MDERMQKLNFTQEYDVRGRYSVAELIPKSKPRTGIYLLEFSDGLCYIGQSVDVARRFTQHRNFYNDIVRLYFKPVKRPDLNVREKGTIYEAPTQGIILTNRDHVSAIIGDSDLDDIITPEQQNEWFEDPTKHQDRTFRFENEGLRISHRKQYQNLKARKDFQRLVGVLRHYVRNTIPAYRKTEVSFWALSALPGTNSSTWPRLSCCSINTMETFIFGHYKGAPNDLWAFVIVSADQFLATSESEEEDVQRLTDFCERFPGARFEATEYKAAADDQMCIFVEGIDQIEAVLHDPLVLSASRQLNLNVMLKGATVQWRGHCLDLADHIVCD